MTSELEALLITP